MSTEIPSHDSLLLDPLYRREVADEDEAERWLDEAEADDPTQPEEWED